MATDQASTITGDTEKAAAQFGRGEPAIVPLGDGLINQTYQVTYSDSAPVVLQCINQAAFPQPENIINNYMRLQATLTSVGNQAIASLLCAKDGKYYWTDQEHNFWRATAFIPNSFSVNIAANPDAVFNAARAFALFTRALQGLPLNQLAIIIPAFHDLAMRYQQFESTVKTARIKRLLQATHVISELRDRVALVDFYKTVASDEKDYPTRAMHHDCKISNILFDKTTLLPICPVDLDTVMPGKYFSDIGDMIRTMACSEDENSNSWENIGVQADYYHAIVKGYLEGMGDALTPAEKKNIHTAGLLLTYMQCMRFVIDFLNNDLYYKTTYEGQNLNRALNQLILLEKLEEFIADID